MGIVSSIGHDISEFAASLIGGKSGIGRLPDGTIAAAIEGFDVETLMSDKMALRLARRAPFTIQTSVVAARQAWQQAGLQDGAVPPERIGLVVAGHNTTQNYVYALSSGFRQKPEYLSPRYALQFMDSNQLGVLSELFGIRGEGFVTGGASASGNVGIIHGARLIEAGIADACLVVGVVADLSPMEIQGFKNVGAMGGKHFHDRPDQACRPFDSQHEGFIHGQAAACVVLEAAASVDARKGRALATLLGGSIDLHATASSEPDIEGEARAMRGALRQSGFDATRVDYVNTHGTASPLGDKVEIAAIERVYGDRFPEVWLNATKGLTGHCLSSAGVVELIACVLQMQQGFLHANKNLEGPIDARARFCGAEAVWTEIDVAMSNSFGFGGINTSIVLQRVRS